MSVLRVASAGWFQIPMSAYIGDPCPKPSLNASTAHRLIAQSALHAWYLHPRLNPNYQPDGNDLTDFGTLAHTVLLKQDYQNIVVVDAPDWRRKDAQATRVAAKQAGKIAVLRPQVDTVAAMVVECRAQLSLSELSHEQLSLVETTGIWQDDGVWFRIRPDLMSTDYKLIIDYKTTSNAQPDAWARGPLVQHGYDLQAALALRGVAALSQVSDAVFVFVVQETRAPYAVSLITLSPAYLAFAQQRLTSAIAQWRHCLASSTWPGYPAGLAYIDPPAWLTWNWELKPEKTFEPPRADDTDEL